MKQVLLSADGLLSVYSVPDIVADNLVGYCNEFDEWLRTNPHAKEYRTDIGVCYTEQDFIKYLNTWIFPDSPSQLIEVLDGVWVDSDVPDEYKKCEWFNF